MVGENVRKCSRSRSNCSCAFLSSRINLLAILRQQVVVTRLIIYESWRVMWQSVMGLRLFPALEHLVNLSGLFSPFHVKHNVLIVYQVSTYSVPLHSVSSWTYFKCAVKRYAHIQEGPHKRISLHFSGCWFLRSATSVCDSRPSGNGPMNREKPPGVSLEQIRRRHLLPRPASWIAARCVPAPPAAGSSGSPLEQRRERILSESKDHSSSIVTSDGTPLPAALPG